MLHEEIRFFKPMMKRTRSPILSNLILFLFYISYFYMLLYDCQQSSLNQQNIKFGSYIKSTKIIGVVKFNIKQIFNLFLKTN